MNELISIIVPVYNTMKYLVRCVESILNQTYKELQIILVDDGSTDGSGALCDDYAAKDKRIFVIHKENGGLSSARNAGLDVAAGKYIGFVDSDDYIEADMYEKMLHEIERHSADMCICSSYDEEENGKKDISITEHSEIILNSEQALERLNPFYDFGMAVWSKLCRTEFFHDIRFPIGKTCEDYYVTPLLFDKCKAIVYLPLPLYHYIQREGSITKNSKSFNDAIEANQFFSNFLRNRHPNIGYVGKSMEVFACTGYILWHIIYKKKIEKKTKKEMLKIARANLHSVLKNKNIKILRKIQVLLFYSNIDIYVWVIKKIKHLD